MLVSQLIEFLDALIPPIRVTGGVKGANDLAKTTTALKPFASMKVEELAAFLELADQYHRTGELPTTVRAAKPRKAATIDMDKVKSAAQQYSALYESSIDAGRDYTALEKDLKVIEKSVSAAEAKELASQLDLPKSLKAKTKIFAELKNRLFDRKESFQRTSF